MTGKEKAFIFEYTHGIPRNQTEAAIKAGYSKKSAKRIASRLMQKPAIKKAIDAELKELHRQNTATVNEILELLTSIMRGEVVDCIEIATGNGKRERVKCKPRARDRLYAAELLGKYYGLFNDNYLSENTKCGVIIISATD